MATQAAQSVEELDLPYLAVDEEQFAADPFPHFRAARGKHPWLATSPFGLYVTDYQAIRELFRAEAKLENPYEGMLELMEAADTPWGRFQQNHILNQAGEAHRRLRDILNPAFTPRQARLHRPLIRQVIAELLDEWVPKGAFDFEEFASYFPITVLCRLIGASTDAIPPLRESLEALGLSVSMDKKHLPALQRGTQIIDDFVQKLVAERRVSRPADGGDDGRNLLDLLLDAQVEGNLSDRELYDLLIFLFAAGYDTSKNILTLVMLELVARPDLYKRCASDLDFCRTVIDETFRFHSTAGSMRTLGEDIVFRDVLLPKGAMLWFPLNVVGRDERVAVRPDEFDPDRPKANAPMPFGLGVHICLGQFIARAQIEEGLHQIAQRMHNPRSPGPAGWRPFPGVWGVRGLPIEFDPAPAVEEAEAVPA